MAWAKNWLHEPLNLTYLPTWPILFRRNLAEKLMHWLGERSEFLERTFNIKLRGQPLAKYIGFVFKIISLYHLRLKIANYAVARRRV